MTQLQIVILGIESSKTDDKDQVCDIVFDLDEDELFNTDPVIADNLEE